MSNIGVVTSVVADHDDAEAQPSWEELLGSKNWEGLLDPLDLSLRRFILRCGDFGNCAVDAFNNDSFSFYAGSSRYGKKSFFDKVKFEFASAYQVSSFLYATAEFDLVVGPWDIETTFIGYIAVSTDAVSQLLGRREIYVVWRGTETIKEWITDFHFPLVSAAPLLRNGGAGEDTVPCVMEGWLKIYTSSNPSSKFTNLSARQQLQAKIKQLIEKDYKDEKLSIVVTGHSLGSALATLSAFDLVENEVVGDIPVAVVGFGCPKVGDRNFAERVQRYTNLHILRINNKLDPVPLYPLDVLVYTTVGEELQIDGMVSPYLNTCWMNLNRFTFHNLHGMLHVVAGWHGKDGKFELVPPNIRCPSLVNKGSDLLKDEYKIPVNWWVIENKGMVRNDQGDWVLAPPLDDDLPVPEF